MVLNNGQSDLDLCPWSLKSNWMFVPNLNNFLQGVPNKIYSKGWDRQMDASRQGKKERIIFSGQTNKLLKTNLFFWTSSFAWIPMYHINNLHATMLVTGTHTSDDYICWWFNFNNLFHEVRHHISLWKFCKPSVLQFNFRHYMDSPFPCYSRDILWPLKRSSSATILSKTTVTTCLTVAAAVLLVMLSLVKCRRKHSTMAWDGTKYESIM